MSASYVYEQKASQGLAKISSVLSRTIQNGFSMESTTPGSVMNSSFFSGGPASTSCSEEASRARGS